MTYRSCLHAIVLCFGVSLLACAQTADTAGEHAEPPTTAQTAAQLARIATLRDSIFPDGLEAGTDTTHAWPFVRAVERFAEAHRDHPETPALLLDAAGLANGTGWGNKAIELWGYVWRWTPEHPRAPEALFYQGFVMDTRYGDYVLAMRYYDKLLARYPDHELAAQARQLREVAARGGTLPPVPAAPGN